jgi:hypothetical protein
MEGQAVDINMFRRMVHKLLKEANTIMDNEVGENKISFWPSNVGLFQHNNLHEKGTKIDIIFCNLLLRHNHNLGCGNDIFYFQHYSCWFCFPIHPLPPLINLFVL